MFKGLFEWWCSLKVKSSCCKGSIVDNSIEVVDYTKNTPPQIHYSSDDGW